MTYHRTGMGQGARVYAESSIGDGVPGMVEARQITPTGEKGPLIPIDTSFARPIGHPGPLVPYATEYARGIGPHGARGPLIPLGIEGCGCGCGVGDWGPISRAVHGPTRVPIMIGMGAVAGLAAAAFLRKNKLAGAGVGAAAGVVVPLVWFDVFRLPSIVPIPDAPETAPEPIVGGVVDEQVNEGAGCCC